MLRVQPNGVRSWVFRLHRDGKPDPEKADQARTAALASLVHEKGAGSPVRINVRGVGVSRQGKRRTAERE